jgi:hemerythrin
MEWTRALAVGHAVIDGQHRELFRRHAQLVEAMKAGDLTEIRRLFDFLGNYVVEHFDEEEQLMKTSGYPAAALHAVAHAAFVREYRALRTEFEEHGPTAAVSIKVKTWIGDWLVTHIAKADQGLALHLRSAA